MRQLAAASKTSWICVNEELGLHSYGKIFIEQLDFSNLFTIRDLWSKHRSKNWRLSYSKISRTKRFSTMYLGCLFSRQTSIRPPIAQRSFWPIIDLISEQARYKLDTAQLCLSLPRNNNEKAGMFCLGMLRYRSINRSDCLNTIANSRSTARTSCACVPN